MRIPLLRGVHLAAHAMLRAAGYRWEVRRSGDLQIGLWRKAFRGKARGATSPRRLVVIPGFGDSPLSWLGVLAPLSPVLRHSHDEIVFVDFPGYGGFLSRQRCFDSMDLLVQTLGDVLDTLRPRTILGHSLGGWLAAYYASECGVGSRPTGNAKVWSGPESIIAVNPAGLFESPAVREEWERKFKSMMDPAGPKFDALRPHVFAREPRWFKLITPEFSRFLDNDEMRQFMGSFRDEHLLTERLGSIRAATWVVWGELDSLMPSGAAAHWMKALGAAGRQAILIPGSGHSPQVERPIALAAVLGQILMDSGMDKVPDMIAKRFWKVVTPTVR